MQRLAADAEPLEPALEIEALGGRAGEQQPRARPALPEEREGLEQLRDPLVHVQEAEAADERGAVDGGRLDRLHRPGRVRDAPDRAAVAGGAHAGLDVARVDDQAVGEVEHGAREREPLRLRLPEERQEVVEDAEAEQPPGDAELALHRVEVAAAVAAADRHPGDQVVEHELVQDDDAVMARAAVAPPQRVDDPACESGSLPTW